MTHDSLMKLYPYDLTKAEVKAAFKETHGYAAKVLDQTGGGWLAGPIKETQDDKTED